MPDENPRRPARTDADAGTAPGGDAIARARAHNDRLLMRALLRAILAGIVIDLLVIAAAATLGGAGALPGALVGSGLALLVTLPTLVSARIARPLPATSSAVVLMGSWLVKMFLLVIALLLLGDAAWLSRPWLGLALLAGALVAAVTEAVGMVRSRARLEVAEHPSEQ
ncbi:hypothetical protein DEO23_12450 [Brachybacterium endophyticum]|uniref:ATP synthase subunit I n=1 Tax=Brachybacterium endophyticum TaxID=2182385 RepID=A0A2U2RHP2_9MICO|nr:hypothetical protein [Brachybacterium endophyticum]PWH05392.1 hypothetical protein DEO23_12450 [Brachybacterium endophyticum]